jgi:transposase-like protein
MSTPIPNKENESKGNGSGPITSYKMSPQELEDYRARTGYKQPKTSEGIDVKPPTIVQNQFKPEEQSDRVKVSWGKRKEEEGKMVAEPSKIEFLQRIAKGQSISAIERAWGMKINSLHYWVTKRWDLKGISPGRARELLAGTTEVAATLEIAEGMKAPEVSEAVKESWTELEKIDDVKSDAVEMVNHPAHYTDGGIEVIDYLRAKLTTEQYAGFMLGNVLKYCSRSRHKGGAEDLKKAKWYLDLLVSEGERETIRSGMQNR